MAVYFFFEKLSVRTIISLIRLMTNVIAVKTSIKASNIDTAIPPLKRKSSRSHPYATALASSLSQIRQKARFFESEAGKKNIQEAGETFSKFTLANRE